MDTASRRPAAVVLVIAVLLAAGLGGCMSSSGGGAASPAGPSGDAEEPSPPEDSIAVRVQHVGREPLSSIYSTSATLRADKQAGVTSRTRGVIRELRVEEGDRVAENEVLAVLEDDEQQIEFSRTSSNLETKRREYERAEQLHRQELLSEEDFEIKRREMQEARHAAELAELNLSRTVIRSPFAGRVLRRHLDVGANVSDGSPVYDIADLEPLYADVQVPERQIGRLAVAQEVRVIADASGGTTQASIERISPIVDPASGTVKVTLAVRNSRALRPGGFVRVEIITETHHEAMVIPRSALVAEGRRWHVYRVNSAGDHVERLEISRGFEEGDRVEILDAPDADPLLSAGDRIVVVGASALSDGAAIEIIDAAPEDSNDADAEGGPREGIGVAT